MYRAKEFCIRARLQPCRKEAIENWALAPAYGETRTKCRREKDIELITRLFRHHEDEFGPQPLQSAQHASLFIDVLRSYTAAKKFMVHDFVVMPDHVHLLLTLDDTVSIEKAMQLIKGGYSYRLKKELGYTGEIWQRGFSEVRVDNQAAFLAHRDYIDQNPVKAGLARTPEEFPYSSAYLRKQKRAGAKAQ